MALEYLLRHVEDAGRREAEQILGDARHEAAQIVARAEARAAARLETARDAERRLRRREADLRLADARREDRGRILRARRALLDRVFGSARQRLAARDARSEVSGGAGAGVPAVVAACLPPGRGAILQGCRWATDDGAIRVDLSAASRLEALRPELEIDLLHELEAG